MARKIEKDKEEKKDPTADVLEVLERKEKKEIEDRRRPGVVFYGTRADRRKKAGLVRRAARTVETEKL